MKYLISTMILFSALQLAAQHDMKNMPGMKMSKKQSTEQAQKVIYTCPMHPEVQMGKPGNCPKCGMTLVKKTIKVAATKTAASKPASSTKTSSTKKPTSISGSNTSGGQAGEIVEIKDMMQEMKSDVAEIKEILKGSVENGAGEIDEHKDHSDHMNMPAQRSGGDDAKQVLKATYTCPMHPEIHADMPGNCPKCGMKLVKEKTQSSLTQTASYTCPMHP